MRYTYYGSYLPDEREVYLTARDESGASVGYASALVGSAAMIADYLRTWKMPGSARITGQRVAYISAAEVDRNARRDHVGSGLLLRLFTLLNAQSVDVVYLHADRSEEQWHRAGFRRIKTGDAITDSSMPLMKLRLKR